MDKSLSMIIIILLSFLLSINSAYSWTSYTHRWICDKINLTDLNCTNADDPKVQSEHPGLNFKYHHCANDAYDCDARVHAIEFLTMNTPDTRGFAAHLFADSMVPVHWYSTDYDTCHKIFEDAVEDKLRKVENIKYDLFKSSYDFSTWNVSMKCLAKYGKENRTVELYADNMYMDSVAKYVAEEMHVSYAPVVVKTRDLTPMFYVLLAFLIIILTLFIYFGLKNKNESTEIGPKSNKKKK